MITEESVLIAIAGKLFLSNWNLPINSAAICCASAALPPFPNKTILFPFFIVDMIFKIADSMIDQGLV